MNKEGKVSVLETKEWKENNERAMKREQENYVKQEKERRQKESQLKSSKLPLLSINFPGSWTNDLPPEKRFKK